MTNTLEITTCEAITTILEEIFPKSVISVKSQKTGRIQIRRFLVDQKQVAIEGINNEIGEAYFQIENEKPLQNPSISWKSDIENALRTWGKTVKSTPETILTTIDGLAAEFKKVGKPSSTTVAPILFSEVVEKIKSFKNLGEFNELASGFGSHNDAEWDITFVFEKGNIVTQGNIDASKEEDSVFGSPAYLTKITLGGV